MDIVYGKPINTDVLHKAIKDRLGEHFHGVHCGGGIVILQLSDDATALEADIAREIFAEHDVTKIAPPEPVPTQADMIAAMQKEIERLKALVEPQKALTMLK